MNTGNFLILDEGPFFGLSSMTRNDIASRRQRDLEELCAREKSLFQLWAMYDRLRQYKRVRDDKPDLGIVRKEVRRLVAQVRELRRRVES